MSSPAPPSMMLPNPAFQFPPKRQLGSLDKGKGRSREGSLDITQGEYDRRSSASSEIIRSALGSSPPVESMAALSLTTSRGPPLGSSSTSGKRKKGAFARIDAWWSAVRGSVSNQADTGKRRVTPTPLSAMTPSTQDPPFLRDEPSPKYVQPTTGPLAPHTPPPRVADRTRSAPAVTQAPAKSAPPMPSPANSILEMPPPPVPVRRHTHRDGHAPSGALLSSRPDVPVGWSGYAPGHSSS